MPVPVQTGFISHTANGSATSFAYDFLVVKAAHMAVFFDGVKQSSGYTVNDVGVSVGGTVDFSVAPLIDVAVVFRRDVPYGRTDFDYQTAGDFLAETVDLDFDTRTMQIQQLRELQTRALSIGEADPLIGGAYNANNNRVKNISPAVDPSDAVTLSNLITEVATQIAAAGSVPFAPAVDPPSTPAFLADANVTYKLGSYTVTLPEAPAHGAWVRLQGGAGNISTDFVASGDDLINYKRITTNATSSGTTTLTDTAHNWRENAWNGAKIRNEHKPSIAAGNIVSTSGNDIATTEDMEWDIGNNGLIGWGATTVDLNCSLIVLFYNSISSMWYLRVSGNGADSILFGTDGETRFLWDEITLINPYPENLQELLNELSQWAEDSVGHTTEIQTGSDWSARLGKYKPAVDIFTDSVARTATMSHSSRGEPRRIINAGTASITLEIGENAGGNGTDTSVLIVPSAGTVSANTATDITIPAGRMVTIHRQDDRFDGDGSDRTAYVVGSSGVTKA